MNAQAYDLIVNGDWDAAWEIEKFPGLSRKEWEAALRRKLYDEAAAKYRAEMGQKNVSSGR